MSHKERPTFYRQELNKTMWEVPERYQNLSPVGSGAYGSVWYGIFLFIYLFCRAFMWSIAQRPNGFHLRPVRVIKRRIDSRSVQSIREGKHTFNICSSVRLQSCSFFELETRHSRSHFVCGWGLVLFLCTFVLQSYFVSKFLRKTHICRSR